MATIITKNSSTGPAVPLSGDLVQGELAVNVTDKKLYTKDSGGSIVVLSEPSAAAEVTLVGVETLTNKTIDASTNTLTGVVTLTGTETLTNKTLTAPIATGAILNDGYTEEVFAVTGTTPALSPTNGSIQTWTLTAASTPTAGTWAAGQSITMMIDDGTAYAITWTSLAITWKTDAGVAPTLNTTGLTAIQLWKVGTTIYGARVGDA